jgi:lipase maturation factor 1
VIELAQEPKPGQPRRGWILYDGECGFCSRWIHLWKGVVEKHGFGVKDLQTARAEGSLQIAPEHLLDDILVVTPDRQRKPGADAYLFVARKIWWAWPFSVLFSFPGLNWLLWWTYRWVNRNRYRLFGSCPLPGAAASPKRAANGDR